MNNWWDIWSRLFDYSDFMARKYCGNWSPELIRMHRVSDFLIWAAYVAIPVVLVSFAWKRRNELPFRNVFWLFAIFIISCGTTHLIDAFMFDYPLYRFSGVVKLITAAASWGTVFALIPIVPQAIQMKSPEVLQREIVERERAEAEVRVLNGDLQTLNAELEERVRERTAELETLNTRLEDVNRGLENANAEKDDLLAREQSARASAESARMQAEDANRAKDEFLATLSHELRTPMNAMMGWITLLGSGRLDEKTQQDAIATIERNTRVQAQLIEDILDVSRIITGKLTLEMHEVQVAPVIDAALSSVRPAAQAKGVTLNADLETEAGLVWGDANRLQQIMWNLVSNAIKFTSKGGEVNVRLQRVNSLLEIKVSDTGEGLAAEVLPHIFERFWQADSSSTRRHGGMGLGLAIVRHLVELHGGSITAQSAGIGYGSTFTVTLPVRAVQTQAHKNEIQQTGQTEVNTTPELLKDIRILVVDDEPDARAVIAMSLKVHGADVQTASSAQEAFAKLQESQPDVLVSDIGMPDEDGYSLIEKVRALPESDGGLVPAVALTAYASASDRARVIAAGFGMHVPKPADPDELATAVASLLGRK